MIQIKSTRNTISREIRIHRAQNDLAIDLAGVDLDSQVIACAKNVFLFDTEIER